MINSTIINLTNKAIKVKEKIINFEKHFGDVLDEDNLLKVILNEVEQIMMLKDKNIQEEKYQLLDERLNGMICLIEDYEESVKSIFSEFKINFLKLQKNIMGIVTVGEDF